MLIIAGWTGQDKASVNIHIRENSLNWRDTARAHLDLLLGCHFVADDPCRCGRCLKATVGFPKNCVPDPKSRLAKRF
jgi:hypothetical protein